ncbi:MAG: 3-deoxy-8-phosphooctulonate synthase [Elusimicrobia bacterium]|nr:3-deoxy-8-phosphooctulonate synthase [Elusimicrobiota bacterium]
MPGNTPANSKTVSIGTMRVGNQIPFTLIAGPCIMESRSHLWHVATQIKKICHELNVQLLFKCSYDKANRTSFKSYRGLGKKEGLRLLSELKHALSLSILTDVHLPQEAEEAAQVADVLQIPAFLCRQTDLVTACARTGKAVNIKKGQFLSPWEMENVLQKVLATGNRKILLTERGTFFGYNNLVVDMRSLEIMKRSGFPVIFDATHSTQFPGGGKNVSGGDRRFVEPLAKAATAIGVAGLFMEVHPNPDKALSDGPNSVKLADLKKMLQTLISVDRLVKGKQSR